MSLYLGTNIVSGAIQDAASKSGTNTFTGTNTFSNTITGTTSGNLDTNASNATSTGKETIAGYSCIEYATTTDVSYPFTAPTKGIAYVRVATSGNDAVLVNNVDIGAILGGGIGSVAVHLDKNDVLQVTGNIVAYVKFFELKGV